MTVPAADPPAVEPPVLTVETSASATPAVTETRTWMHTVEDGYVPIAAATVRDGSDTWTVAGPAVNSPTHTYVRDNGLLSAPISVRAGVIVWVEDGVLVVVEGGNLREVPLALPTPGPGAWAPNRSYVTLASPLTVDVVNRGYIYIAVLMPPADNLPTVKAVETTVNLVDLNSGDCLLPSWLRTHYYQLTEQMTT